LRRRKCINCTRPKNADPGRREKQLRRKKNETNYIKKISKNIRKWAEKTEKMAYFVLMHKKKGTRYVSFNKNHKKAKNV
jgi:hypothetical protein